MEYKTTTLCWNCANTNDSCSWFSKAARPVPGWKAKKVKYKMANGEYVDSYTVKEFLKRGRLLNREILELTEARTRAFNAACGDMKKAIYWIAAAVLNITVTF